MAPFKRPNLKKRLRVPLAVSRFYHEQMIRLRFCRAGIQKQLTREKRDRQERGLYQNPLYTGLPPELFPESESSPEQNVEVDLDAKGTKGEVWQLIGGLFKRLSHARPSLGNAPADGQGNNQANSPASVATVASLLLALLLLILPTYYFYISRQLYPVYILIALAFAVVAFCKISSGEMRLLRSPLDTAVFLLSGLAIISSIGAWNTGEAINLALLLSCSAALYWTVSSIVNNLAALRRFLAVIIAGTAAAALLCLPSIFQEGASFPFAEALGAISIAALLFVFYLRTASPSVASEETAAHPNDPGGDPSNPMDRSAKGMASFLRSKAASEAAAGNTTAQSQAAAETATATDSATVQWQATAGTTTAEEGTWWSPWQTASLYNSYEANGAFFQNNTAYPSDLAAPYRNYRTDRNEAARNPKAAALLQRAKAAFQKYRTTHQKEWANTALSAASYLLLLAVIGLGSVLNYIILTIGITLILWKLQTAECKKCLAHFLPNAAAAFLVAGRARLCLVSGDITASWLWAALGLMIVIALEYTAVLTAAFLKKTGRRLRPWVRPGAALLLTLLLLHSGTAYLRSDLSPISQSAYNYAQYYMEEKLLKGLDALCVMTSSPRILLQGTGGGGWEPLAYQHQSFYYRDSPPGAFAQAGVEMGLPGLAVLLAVWILFIKEMRRIIAQKGALRVLRSINSHEQNAAHRERTGRSGRTVGRDAASSQHKAAQLKGDAWKVSWAVSHTNSCDKEENVLLKEAAWAIFTAAILVGIYSLVECTISIAAVSLFLFTLIGLGKALGRFSISERYKSSRYPERPENPEIIGHPARRENLEHPENFESPGRQGCPESAKTPEYSKRPENPEHLERPRSSERPDDTSNSKISKSLLRGFRPQSHSSGKRFLQYFAVSGTVLLVMIISLNNFAGESCSLKAAQAIKQGDIQTAEMNYKEAVRMDPLNAVYRKELGKIYLKYDQATHPVSTAGSYSSAQSGLPVTVSNDSEPDLIAEGSQNRQAASPVNAASPYGGTRSEPGISSRTQNSSQNDNVLLLACEQFERGIHLARGDAELRTLYASTLLQTGQPEEGVWQLETAVSLRPLQQDLYENLALGYVTAAQLLQGWHGDLSSATSLLAGPLHPDYATGSKASHSHRNGFPDKTGNKTVPLPAELTSKKKAHLYLSRTMAIPKLLEKRAAQINKRHLRYWSGAPYLGITPKIQLYCGQAAVLLGDKKPARHYLEQAARDASLEPEAQRWHRRGAGTFPLPHF